MAKKLTKFQEDLLAVISEGHCYTEHMSLELHRRGRTKIDPSRLLSARYALIKKGLVKVSLAGRTEVVQ